MSRRGKQPTPAPPQDLDKVAITKADFWAHRVPHVAAKVDARGFPAVVHRDRVRRILDHEPWVLFQFRPNEDFNINASLHISDAERMRDQLDAAIRHAKTQEPCEASCAFCTGNPAPADFPETLPADASDPAADPPKPGRSKA